MRTQAARVNRVGNAGAWIAAALALALLLGFAGCVGPGLEPPAHDRNSGMSPGPGAAGTPPVARGGSGGSSPSTGTAGSFADAGMSAQAGAGSAAGAGGSPDVPGPDGGMPQFDAGGDEDAGSD